MDDHPQNLKSLFAAAEVRREALEGAYEASSPGYREALDAAITEYQQCLSQIDTLGLFSPNETADDLSTADLPYLVVDFHLAELIQKTPAPLPADRKLILARARAAYERFLHLADSYGLLAPAHARLLTSYTDDPTAFSTVAAADMTARRQAKIDNFRAEKALRQQLAALRRHPHYGDDDETVRAAALAHVRLAGHLALQALEGLNREADVLAVAPVPLIPGATSVEEDEAARRHREAQGYSERLDMPLRRLQSAFNGAGSGPLLSKEGRPLQPFTIVGDRAELAKGVFKSGHNLPTMSIDEYLAEERRRGGIIEGGGEASGVQPEPDEDDMDKADQETYKAREWDEFTEANPKGAGNTMNRG